LNWWFGIYVNLRESVDDMFDRMGETPVPRGKERTMKRVMNLVVVLGLLLTPVAWAAEPDAIAKMDETLKAVATYEYGKDASVPSRLEDLVVAAGKDPQLRLQAEERLIGLLAGDATVDAKALVCRHLRTIGTAKCIPQLEALLIDGRLSHMARYALGSMQDAASAEALRRALGKTTGLTQAGIINTLGDRHVAGAVPELARLLGSSDAVVAEAAASSLGKIGGEEAAKALQAVRGKGDEAMQKKVDDALLACADHFLAGGNKAEAIALFKSFNTAQTPKRLRLAALRGLVVSGDAAGEAFLIEAITGADQDLRHAAIGFVPLARTGGATAAFVKLLPTLDPASQDVLIRALAERGDATAMPAIVSAVQSGDENVRVAALDALGTLGTATTVEVLCKAASGGKEAEQQVARASMLRLKGQDVDAALVASLSAAGGDARVQAEAIRALAGRNATSAIPTLLKYAKDDDASVRHEAIAALGGLVREAELASVVDLAVSPRDAADLPAIENALSAAFRRITDPEKQAAPILAALEKAPATARPSLVRLLARSGTPKALAAVRAALKDGDAALQDAALRTLADWPNTDAADDLLQMASKSINPTHRVLALRGYVRIAGLSKNATAMYLRAMELADRADDKRLVLAGLGSADTVQALDVAEKYLKDEQLKNEAGSAVTQIADKVRAADPARALAAVKGVLAAVNEPGVRGKAQTVLNELERFDGYILTWSISGPYKQDGKDGNALFNIAFAPEKAEGEAKWQPLDKGVGAWDISLDTAIGGGDNQAAYMRCRVVSPAAMDAQLELGSDDAIKVWLNGKVVHAKNVDRGLTAREDIVKVHLNQGANDLMIEVINKAGGWGFACRVRKTDGTAIEGLKYER
jgi:HEAT repeat protein